MRQGARARNKGFGRDIDRSGFGEVLTLSFMAFGREMDYY